MNSLMNTEMTREQKEEFANRRLIEMREKNEKLMQRHAEVLQDQKDAEEQCASIITKGKLPVNRYEDQEEIPKLKSNPKEREWDIGKSSTPKEREWDIGKGAAGEWNPNIENDYHSSNYNRKSGYSNFDRRRGFTEEKRSYDPVRRNERFRGNARHFDTRQHDSNQTRSNFHSENSRNYQRGNYQPSNRWNGRGDIRRNPRGSYRSNFPNQNSHQRNQSKYDNDRVWKDDGMNDIQNKQNRVETWVKSISSVESWTENDERPSKSLGSSTKQGFNNRQHNISDDFQKHTFTKNEGMRYEHKKSFGLHEKVPENELAKLDKSGQADKDRLGNYEVKIEGSNTKKSYIEQQAELHMQGRYEKPKLSGVSNYDSKLKIEVHQSGNDNRKRNVKYSGTWSDEECDISKDKKTGGTWSDDDIQEISNTDGEKSKKDVKQHNFSNKKTEYKYSSTWNDEKYSNQRDKDSGSWTDVDDSYENSDNPPRTSNYCNKSRGGGRFRGYDNKRGSFKYSNDQRYPNQRDRRTNSDTWNDKEDSYQTTQSSVYGAKSKRGTRPYGFDSKERSYSYSNTWSDKKSGNQHSRKESGNWGDAEESPETDTQQGSKFICKPKREIKLRGNETTVHKDHTKHEKCDRNNSGTWSDVEDSNESPPQNKWGWNEGKDNFGRTPYRQKQSDGQRNFPNAENKVELMRSKSLHERTSDYKRKNETPGKNKDSGTWSDQECDNTDNGANWTCEWDTDGKAGQQQDLHENTTSEEPKYQERCTYATNCSLDDQKDSQWETYEQPTANLEIAQEEKIKNENLNVGNETENEQEEIYGKEKSDIEDKLETDIIGFKNQNFEKDSKMSLYEVEDTGYQHNYTDITNHSKDVGSEKNEANVNNEEVINPDNIIAEHLNTKETDHQCSNIDFQLAGVAENDIPAPKNVLLIQESNFSNVVGNQLSSYEISLSNPEKQHAETIEQKCNVLEPSSTDFCVNISSGTDDKNISDSSSPNKTIEQSEIDDNSEPKMESFSDSKAPVTSSSALSSNEKID